MEDHEDPMDRIVACWRACQDVPTAELREGELGRLRKLVVARDSQLWDAADLLKETVGYLPERLRDRISDFLGNDGDK